MTAGEGECLGLDADEAYRRMIDGRKLIEDIIGRPVADFIAPAWLYGQGALDALNRAGFPIAEDHIKVWQPNGAILTRGPVITWVSRSNGRIASSITFAALARAALHILPIVRIAVHPGDSHVPALLRCIDSTIRSFARNRVAGRYGDLAPIP
jgi:predicted deacetylase